MTHEDPGTRFDPAAFEAVVSPLWERLARFARHLCGCAHAGDDLAAEAVAILFRRRRDVERGKEAAFLFSCCRNLLRNRRRDLARHGEVALDETREAAAAGDPGPGAEARVDLERALSRLDPENREILLLRTLGDLTVPEIAAACGMKEGTVKSRLHTAALRMRGLLKGYPA